MATKKTTAKDGGADAKNVPLDIDSVDFEEKNKTSKSSKTAPKPAEAAPKTITTTMTSKKVETSVSANTRPANSVANSQLAKGRTVSEEVVIEAVEPATGGVTVPYEKSRIKTVSEEQVLRSIAYHKRNVKSNESIEYVIKRPKKRYTVHIEGSERFNPDYTEGLNKMQVQSRYDNLLANYVTKSNAKTYGNIFASNILSVFNLLCLIVAAALIAIGSFDQLTFMVIITLNIAIGIFQEIRSKRMIEKLSLVTSPTAVVVRDGEKEVIPVDEVVLDDIIYYESGKQICTDSIVVHGEVEANEALLTGESVPVKKKVGDLLFAGSFVSSGSCHARAERVGSANYIEGLTAEAKKYRKPKSELMNSLRKLINIICILIVPITALMLWTSYMKLNNIEESIIQTSGSAIGMIPAGMFLLTTVALAASVVRLAKKKALVQDLYCIEMLARADTLCLDKTGTITDGTMRVQNVIELRNDLEASVPAIIGSMLTATEDNNQTAQALAAHFGYSSAMKAKVVMPFSSARKYSAVTFENGSTYMLGAPEFIMKEYGPRIDKIINENASQGYRVMMLATAQGEIKNNDYISVARRVAAIIVIEDHIREEAPATIKWFKENDVAVKVISGDNPVTVSEVAKRVGIEKAELYVSLDGLSNQEVIEAANKYTVFGRVTPEQKALLIKSIKSQGHTVAMTGDGVNDILALKEADCSIAIASGAEAARNVSHLVLMNNNFNSMPSVVKEGRRVINNISKSSSLYLMKTLFSIILSITILFSTLLPANMALTYPFAPKQLLLLEFFVIGVPSLFLAMQENKNRIQGRFIHNLISNSVPGALTLFVSVMAIIIFQPHSSLAGQKFTDPEMATMLVWAFTGTGFVILFKLCIPIDVLRGCMFLGVIVGCTVAVLGSNSWYFKFVSLSFTNMLFLIVVILSSYAVLSLFQTIARELKKAGAGNKDPLLQDTQKEVNK